MLSNTASIDVLPDASITEEDDLVLGNTYGGSVEFVQVAQSRGQHAISGVVNARQPCCTKHDRLWTFAQRVQQECRIPGQRAAQWSVMMCLSLIH